MARRIEITVRSCAVWQQLAGKSPWICWSWPWNTSAVGRRHAWSLERTARGSVGGGRPTGSCAAFSQQHFRRWYLVLLSQPPRSLPLSLQPCPVASCLPSWSCRSSTPDCRAWHFGWWSGRSKPRYSCQPWIVSAFWESTCAGLPSCSMPQCLATSLTCCRWWCPGTYSSWLFPLAGPWWRSGPYWPLLCGSWWRLLWSWSRSTPGSSCRTIQSGPPRPVCMTSRPPGSDLTRMCRPRTWPSHCRLLCCGREPRRDQEQWLRWSWAGSVGKAVVADYPGASLHWLFPQQLRILSSSCDSEAISGVH